MKGLYLLVGALLVASFTFGQAGNYRSRVTGPWNTAGTWERDADSNGSFEESPASVAPTVHTTAGTITIQSGHTVTVNSSRTVDQITIENGGTLQVDVTMVLTLNDGAGKDLSINSGGTFQLLDDAFFDGSSLVANAYVDNSGSIIYDASLSSITFGSTSTYEHSQNGGTIPTASWNNNSLLYVTGAASGTAPTGFANQDFGRFTWDCPNQVGTKNLALAGTRTFAGDVSILSTGASGGLAFSTTNLTTITIGGNFTISNLVPSTTSSFTLTQLQTVTLNVNGNYNNSSTGLSRLAISGTGAGVGVMNVRGNFTQSAGTLQGVASSFGSMVNFTGTGVQTLTSGGTFTAVNFTVKNGSTLNLPGNNAVSGTGTFTVETGGKVLVGSKDSGGAIQTGGAGNIQVSGTRTYNSSTIVYDGNAINGNTAGAQTIGNGQPPGSGVITRIDNPSGVSLSASLVIVGTLILDNGNLSVGSNTLTLNGSFTPNTNALVTTTASNLAIGGSGALVLTITGSTTINSLVLTRSGTIQLGSDITIETNGSFSQDVTNLDLNGKVFTIKSDFAQTNGATITANAASSLIIDGTGLLPASVSLSGSAINTLENNRSTPTFAISPNITVTNLKLTLGTLSNSGTITMASGGLITRANGALTGTALGAVSSYNVTYLNSGSISTGGELPSSISQLNDLTITGAGALSLTKAITTNGTLTFGGSFSSGGFAIDVKGASFVSNVGPTLTSSTVTFSGTGTTITGSAAPTFGNITVTGVLTPSSSLNINGDLVNDGTLNAGSGTTTFGGTTTISGSSTSSFNNITISGTLNAPTGNFNVGGIWTNNGTFNKGSNSNTVTFTGTSLIAGSSTTNFGGITISGTLAVPLAALNVGGNFTNNGTFTAGVGTLVLNGSTAQLIQGSTNTTFRNISSSNLSSVTVQTSQSMTGALILSAGVFNANGNLTLISNASGDARIAQITGGATISGSIIAQRYLPNTAAARAYRFLSSPVTNAFASDWKAEFPITGTFNDPSTQAEWPAIPNVNQSSPSMFVYNEAHTPTATIDDRYESFPPNGSSSTSTPLVNGNGYAAFVRQSAPIVLNLTGTPQQGNVPVSVTAQSGGGNDGWNLIGNPYAAPINWDNVTIPGGVSSQIAFKDNTNNIGLGAGAYVYFTQGSPGTGIPASYTGTIASGQGFWVRATSSTTITFKEGDKQSISAPVFIREGMTPNVARVHIYGNGKHDEIVLRFVEDGNDAGDTQYDAFKLKNDFINLSSLSSDGKKLAINGMGRLSCFKQVPLVVDGVTPGAHSFSFSQLDSFDPQMSIRLLDSFTGNSFTVTNQSSVYDFSITSDPTSFGSTRFVLVFGEAVSSITAKSGATCNAGTVTLSASGATDGSYRWYESAVGGIAIQGATSSTFTTPTLTATKTYHVAATNSGGCEELRIPVVATINVAASTITTKDGTTCNTGSITLSASGAAEGSYHWYETASGGNPIADATSGTYQTPVLTNSKTYYVSATNANGCEEIRKPVLAVVTVFSQVTITEEGKALKSSYTEGNQWYFNGQLIAGATGQSIEPKETGVYKLTVTSASGCTSSTERQYTVAMVTAVEDEVIIPASISIYPNPTTDVVNVSVHSSKPVSARIVTVLGVTLNEQQLQGADTKQGSFNLRDQSEGIYLLIVQDGSHVYKTRIIKKR